MKKEIVLLNAEAGVFKNNFVGFLEERCDFQVLCIEDRIKDMVHRAYNIKVDGEFVDSKYFKDSFNTKRVEFYGREPREVYHDFIRDFLMEGHKINDLSEMLIREIEDSDKKRFIFRDANLKTFYRDFLSYFGDQCLCVKFVDSCTVRKNKRKSISFDGEEIKPLDCVSTSGRMRISTYVLSDRESDEDLYRRFKKNYGLFFNKELKENV